MKILVGSTIALCCSLSVVSHAETVSMISMNWAPFIGEDLERNGFLSAIAKESLAAAGYESDIEFTKWSVALESVKSGKKDAVLGGYFSEERDKIYHFSIPLYTVLSGLVKMKGLDLDFFGSYEELNNYKIGRLKGGITSEDFDVYEFDHLKKYATFEDGLSALVSGEIDVYADNLSSLRAKAPTVGIDPMSLEMVLPPLKENEVYLLFSKEIPNSEALRNAFNQGLMTIQSNGVYQQILIDFNQN